MVEIHFNSRKTLLLYYSFFVLVLYYRKLKIKMCILRKNEEY